VSIPLLRPVDTRASGDFFSADSWKTAGAKPYVVDAAKSLGFSRPSHVQAASFKHLSRKSSHAVVADRAGSGKTLAYLLPLVQALREDERADAAPRLPAPHRDRPD